MTASSLPSLLTPPVPLVGDGLPALCADGTERPYLSMDAAASTAALPQVAARVSDRRQAASPPRRSDTSARPERRSRLAAIDDRVPPAQ
jgi:hypothetical protein